MRKFLLAYTMLAALGAPAMADPFVSGSEPGWGKHMSAQQRRAIGDDDVRTALKHNRKPDASPSGVAAITPTSGVLGYAFNLITIKDSGGFGQILLNRLACLLRCKNAIWRERKRSQNWVVLVCCIKTRMHLIS
jgi:hypothetical protein